MARVPALSRDDLSEEARGVYDEIMATRGEVDRPFQILLSAPQVLERIAHLGTYIRYGSSLPASIRECIILAVARETSCEFEWVGHEPQAREAGISEKTIDALRIGEDPSSPNEDENAVISFVYENLRNQRVTDGTFRKVQDLFGTEKTTEIAATIGYYVMLANIINAFDDGN